MSPRRSAAPVVLPLALGAVGLALAVVTSGWTWAEPEYRVARPVLLLIAAAGLVILGLAARHARRSGPDGVSALATALGACVLGYPSLLAAAATAGAPAALVAAAAAGHTPPLTLVQLLPVVAVARATGRRRRAWVVAVVAVAVVGGATTGAGLAGAPGAPALLALSLVLWFGSFALPPVATWTAVRGTSGEVRRRAVVAGLAALVPVVVIVWCMVLGTAVAAVAPGVEAGTTAIMVGFAAGTLACAVLSTGAVGPAEARLLRTGVVVGVLDGLLAALTLLAAVAAALVASGLATPPPVAVGVGVLVAVVLGLPWLRWRSWAARVVDPARELRHELSAVEQLVPGRRQAAQQVIRRVVADPGAALLLATGPGEWVDVKDATIPDAEHDLHAVVLARDHGGAPVAVVRAGTEAAVPRLRRLGDCGELLEPARWEAREAAAARRADRAAALERERLSQDLHDGLQGRLLGLALRLQLSGRDLEDPAARLLLEETVDGLRGAVDDVRALGDGRLPALLVDHGLQVALAELFRPLGPVVDLDVLPGRVGPAAEATAWFVVGEAVANALKHASPGRVDVRVEAVDARLLVTVTDDGVGGADPRLGSGLRGLSERVRADGGVLLVRDGGARGTVVEAVLPCGS